MYEISFWLSPFHPFIAILCTNYLFILKVKGSPDFHVDTVWIGNRPYRPQLIPMEQEGYYKLAMSYNKRPKNMEDPQSEWQWHETPAESDNPPEFDGTALIIYRVNGERRTLEYKKEFRVEEPLNYP